MYEYNLLQVVLKDGVATATIDAPPINVMTAPLFGELIRFGQQVGDDDEAPRVNAGGAHGPAEPAVARPALTRAVIPKKRHHVGGSGRAPRRVRR